MRQAITGSTRYAYLFVSVNLVLLMAFFLSMSISVRQIDASRSRYEQLARDWFALRVAAVYPTSTTDYAEHLRRFDSSLYRMFHSEFFGAAERLYHPLAASAGTIMQTWQRLEPELAADARLHESGRSAYDETLSAAFQGALLGFEGALGEFVGLQQRAIRILLYFLGATIVATVAIFFFVEAELAGERRAAALVRTFARGSIDAQEQERERISRALHDSLAQELTLTMFEVGELTGPQPTTVRINDRLKRAIDWVRDLAHELHPAEIDQLGLAGAIRAYCLDVEGSGRPKIECMAQDLSVDLSRGRAINIYRIAQEAVTNALRHAKATRIDVRLEVQTGGDLVLSVEDNGEGFKRWSVVPAHDRSGMGMVSMQERARMLHAEFNVETAPGMGTRIAVRLPASALDDGEES